MELKKLCQCCLGSRKMIGGGMMRIDCTQCNGEGYIYPKQALKQSQHAKEATKTIDKRSKSYQKAIKDLVDLGMTKEEAKAQFDKVV